VGGFGLFHNYFEMGFNRVSSELYENATATRRLINLSHVKYLHCFVGMQDGKALLGKVLERLQFHG